MKEYPDVIIRPKKQLFLGAYFVYVLSLLFVPIFYKPSTAFLGPVLAILIFVSAGIIAMSMRGRKVFLGRVNYILFAGISLWIFYGFLLHLSGIFLYTTVNAYRELITLSAFTLTLFLVSRIILAYGWKLEMIKVFLLGFGISLITVYALNFDNFGIARNLGSVFNVYERYRFAFGLGNPNTAGRYALYFLAYAFIYRAASEERGHSPRKLDSFSAYFIVPVSIVAAVILLSSGSRASITSLILFFLVYYSLSFYSKRSASIRVILIVSAIIIALLVVSVVDWNYVLIMSNRQLNYKAIEVIADKNVWLMGMGFIKFSELFSAVNLPYLDSFYLTVFIQSGLIGSAIFFGTIFWYAIIYFRNAAEMNKFQRAVGGILAVLLYYGMFESFMFGHGYLEMTSWSLLIAETSNMAHSLRENTSARVKPVKYSPHILHNS